jgi:vacuolar-type H+-ATPase subunit H
VVVKDHKKTPGESRPIVTGCSGNTRGLSNSVSNFLESIANTIENQFECISSEDMLANTKKANKEVIEIIKKWKEHRLKKINCAQCNYRADPHKACQDCQNEVDELDNNDPEKTTKMMEIRYDCDECGREWRDRMEEECAACGEGLFWEDQAICLLGLDVVALFPSMTSINTGKIIRKHVLQSPIIIEGFDWRQGARYLVINKKYTGDIRGLWSVLPWRRKVGGTAPGIKSKEINSKKGNVEADWCFPRKEPTKDQIREIQARCAEIATRFIFENFCYKFAGEIYQQSAGGPIGARVTMAAARIVMSDWGEGWRRILERAGVKLPQLDGYVDDVRQRSTSLRFGMRWNTTEGAFTWSQEDKDEDHQPDHQPEDG